MTLYPKKNVLNYFAGKIGPFTVPGGASRRVQGDDSMVRNAEISQGTVGKEGSRVTGASFF